jgi:ABC-type dipeptide/oligopeptide/nickel transport system ATPase component
VLRHGQVKEASDATTFFSGPKDPYSRALLDAMATTPLGPEPRPANGDGPQSPAELWLPLLPGNQERNTEP